MMAAGGAALLAGASDAFGRARGFASAGGVRSTEDLARVTAEMRQREIRLFNQAELSPEAAAAAHDRVLSVASSSGMDPTELMAGLEAAQARFNNLGTVLDNLSGLADVARTTGASFDAVVEATSVAERQFNLTSEETARFTDMMVEAGNTGSIDAANLAGSFGAALGEIRRGTAMGGLEGARQALGVAEVLGSGDVSPDEAATRSVRFIASLNNSEVQGRLRRNGVNVNDAEGAMRPIEEIIADLSRVNPRSLRGIFREERASSAAGILTTAFRDNPEMVSNMFSVSGEGGRSFVERTAVALDEDPSSRFLRQGTNQVVDFMREGDPAAVWGGAADVNSPITSWMAENPILSQFLGVAGTMVSALGGMAAMQSVMGAGGGAAGGGLLGTLGAWGTGALTMGGLATGVGAAGAVTLVAADAGDSGASLDIASRDRAIRRELSPEASAAYEESLGAAGSVGRGTALMGAIESRGATSLDAATIRALAAAIGIEVSRASTTTPPAGGRSTGEPGRRS